MSTELQEKHKEKHIPNIHEKIIGIMSELDYIQKGPKAVNGQYRYASHDQVTAALHPLLVKYKVTLIPTVEEIVQEGNRTMIKEVITFVNAECPSDNISIRSVGYGIDTGDKGPGKAISYAYKYALLKTFCLETGDDPDNDAEASYEPPKCLEFDSLLPMDMSDKDREKMSKFLSHSSQALKKPIEDVKREATKRFPEFLIAFNKWKPKE